MKKNLLRISMVAMCAILMSGLMTGCNKDKNEPDDPQNPDAGPAVAARADATFIVSKDMLKLLDITIDYYSSDGSQKQLALTTEEFHLDTKAALPAKAGMLVSLKIKDGVDPASFEEVDFRSHIAFKCAAVDANDIIIGEMHKVDGVSLGAIMAGKNAQTFVDAWNKEHPASFLFDFDKDGNSKSIKW